jgi:FkbM family methyltransferase
MTNQFFISYAQNFEDVMLWRALRHVKNGFYIDVGANDPIIDSVTKGFYELGWRGINIEPLTQYWKNLVKDRPEDINLCCAAGDVAGELELWDAELRGLATADQEVMRRHIIEGLQGTLRKVPVSTLTQICEKYIYDQDIHFLKLSNNLL